MADVDPKPRYQDYVIKDGEFIGRFEEMYKEFNDPWQSVATVDSLKNDILQASIRRKRTWQGFIHAGCGLGALSARVREVLPKDCPLWALDISPTAIVKARAAYAGIEFLVHDLTDTAGLIQQFAGVSVDGILLAETMWYILPDMDRILRAFQQMLEPGGKLFVLQYFLDPAEQTYGRSFISDPQDLAARLLQAGFNLKHEITIDSRSTGQFLFICAKESITK